MTKTLSEIKAEAGRDLDSSLADTTLVPGESSNFGAFSFGALWNWIKGKCATVVQSGNNNPVTSGAVKAELDASYYNKQSVDGKLTNHTQTIFNRQNNNDLPDYYITNYPKSVVHEFKVSTVIGLSSSDYVYTDLTTYVSWNDNSVSLVQIAYAGEKIYRRISGVRSNTWGTWQKLATEGDLNSIPYMLTILCRDDFVADNQTINLTMPKAGILHIDSFNQTQASSGGYYYMIYNDSVNIQKGNNNFNVSKNQNIKLIWQKNNKGLYVVWIE